MYMYVYIEAVLRDDAVPDFKDMLARGTTSEFPPTAICIWALIRVLYVDINDVFFFRCAFRTCTLAPFTQRFYLSRMNRE